MSEDVACARVFISGRVQGVGYRMYCSEEAEGHGLAGWVRNLPDGRVEALFQGPRESVEGMIEWCRQGPPAAHVIDVAVEWQPARSDLKGFRITY
ncbi:MAG: acylphosphatase [Planctomycetes bacterium]|nr:acylphosphatase [Planctomycetota bacterium]